jgi:hypothetical protein
MGQETTRRIGAIFDRSLSRVTAAASFSNCQGVPYKSAPFL